MVGFVRANVSQMVADGAVAAATVITFATATI